MSVKRNVQHSTDILTKTQPCKLQMEGILLGCDGMISGLNVQKRTSEFQPVQLQVRYLIPPSLFERVGFLSHAILQVPTSTSDKWWNRQTRAAAYAHTEGLNYSLTLGCFSTQRTTMVLPSVFLPLLVPTCSCSLIS